MDYLLSAQPMSTPRDLIRRLALLSICLLRSISAVDFVYNGFHDPSSLLFYGDASLRSTHLAVTNDSTFSLGRCFHRSKIPSKVSDSLAGPFSTSFIFAISRVKKYRPGHGLVFLFAPSPGIIGASSAQNLALFNFSNDGKPENHIFAVEFDLFPNPEFKDVDGNHVGVDVNSLSSVYAHTAGYFPDTNPSSFVNLTLNNGANYQVWVDYDNLTLNVTMAPAGVRKPKLPLISNPLNLSDIFLGEMFVGFGAATGKLVQSHRILAWSFSNSNFSAHEALITSNLPSFVPKEESVLKSTGFIAGISVATFVFIISCIAISLFLIRRLHRGKEKDREGMEDWELDYWPHRMGYQEIYSATKGFSEGNVIGVGGNGKVYKGVLNGGAEVAVKSIAHGSEDGVREFLAEVSSLGRLRHRNLVGLRGWCKKESATFLLVYDFMENSSLDKWIFSSDPDRVLSWENRLRILKDVGSALLYLHEGWESRVLHRDIKASNVMLDGEMNARLGDFGLARLQTHSQAVSTTRVVGTVGYMAPEVVQTGKASAKTDVFSFGALVLEISCGRRPVEEGKPLLIPHVWGLLESGQLAAALDENLRRNGGYEEGEVERILQLGLLCTYPDPKCRPNMKQVMRVLEGGPSERREEDFGLEEEMEAYLLKKVQTGSGSIWSNYYAARKAAHPTFEELKEGFSSTPSISDTDILIDGRRRWGYRNGGGSRVAVEWKMSNLFLGEVRKPKI